MLCVSKNWLLSEIFFFVRTDDEQEKIYFYVYASWCRVAKRGENEIYIRHRQKRACSYTNDFCSILCEVHVRKLLFIALVIFGVRGYNKLDCYNNVIQMGSPFNFRLFLMLSNGLFFLLFTNSESGELKIRLILRFRFSVFEIYWFLSISWTFLTFCFHSSLLKNLLILSNFKRHWKSTLKIHFHLIYVFANWNIQINYTKF